MTSHSVDALVAVGDVEEKVLFPVLLVQGADGRRGRGNDVVDEEEECVFRSQLDSLSNEEVELADGQV